MIQLYFLALDFGALYAAGGWSDQPEWFVKACGILRTEILLWEKKKSRSSSPEKTRPQTS